MSTAPPPSPYNLHRTIFAVALLLPLGMVYYWSHGAAHPWAWAGGITWMMANLYCLDRLIRAVLVPPGQLQRQAAALFGVLVMVVMPLTLFFLLNWCAGAGTLIPVTIGITMPLVLVVLRALGSLLQSQSGKGPGTKPSD